MPKYRYIVINPENQQLSGTINAPDETSSREELSQLGFSIISITEITDTAAEDTSQKPLPKFEFAATDKNKKHVVGTIQGQDIFEAYKRLINEYLFEVETLVDESLPEATKVTERQKGVFELQNRLDMEAQNVKKESSKEMDIKEFEAKQQVLQTQVEFVLKKVKEMLDLYETELKPEVKEKMRVLVDKILRIKSSTNLDYIRTTCEELLTFLQKEEIFLHEDIRRREHTQMAIEAKSMMMQLHKNKAGGNLSLREKLLNWREIHINNNDRPTFIEKTINILVGLVVGFHEETPEMKDIQQKKKVINQQLKQYIILYFQSPSQEYKLEARESLNKLWKERKKIINQLKSAKKLQKTEQKTKAESTSLENFSEEILTFSGWLLTFYLCFYFVSLNLVNKNLGFELPHNLTIYNTSFLKYLLSVLFLFHASLSVKMNFFKRNEVATFVIAPVFVLGSLLVILNF